MRFRTRLLSFTIVILGMTCNAYGQASFDDGLTARYAGDLETAAQIFSDLTQENPENSDAWVQLGLTHLTLENYDEAEAALKRAIEIAPDYSDAYLGLARLEWFRGNREPAEEYLSLAGDTEDTRALRRQINATPDVKKWRADIGLGYSDLSNSLPSWEQVDVALGYQFSEDTSATIGLQYANRFNISDVYVDAGLTHTLKNRTLLFASVGTAPDGDFRPEFQFRAGSEFPLVSSKDRGVELWTRIDASTASFSSGDVQSLGAGLQLRLHNDRYRIGANLIGLSDEAGESRSGFALNGEWQATRIARLLIGYVDAPETSEGITVDVRTVQLGCRFDFEDRGFQVFALSEERGAYDRTGVVFATNWRF